MSRDAAVTMLNRLTAVAHDGVEGFRLAAERAGADDPQLRAMLTQLATDRQAVITALQEAVRGLGDEPETAGTLAGTAHRALVGLWAAVGADEVGRDALLADVERGEDDAVAQFERELAEGGGELPPEMRTLVETQLTQLRRSRACVGTLRRGGGGAGS